MWYKILFTRSYIPRVPKSHAPPGYYNAIITTISQTCITCYFFFCFSICPCRTSSFGKLRGCLSLDQKHRLENNVFLIDEVIHVFGNHSSLRTFDTYGKKQKTSAFVCRLHVTVKTEPFLPKCMRQSSLGKVWSHWAPVCLCCNNLTPSPWDCTWEREEIFLVA